MDVFWIVIVLLVDADVLEEYAASNLQGCWWCVGSEKNCLHKVTRRVVMISLHNSAFLIKIR
jgi:hypothetical protein